MKLRGYYTKKEPPGKKLEISYDKKSKDRPAWIQIKGLPDKTTFIVIHLGKKGKAGKRIQFYKIHLPHGLFLPIDYTSEEMQEYYNKLAKIYDKEMKKTNYNIKAGKFLCQRLKKYAKGGASILDLGAGTGLITEIYIDSGFNDITLVDYSKGMLKKAKERSKLKKCKFLHADVKKLKLRKKYDVIISHFSLGSSTYYNEEDMKNVLKLIKRYMNPKGIIAVLGHFNVGLFEKYFKKLESGVHTLDKKREFFTDYFIGKK